MRQFLLWLLLAWVGGIVLGVAGLDWRAVLLTAVGAAIFAWLRREPTQLLVVSVMLLALGFVWGLGPGDKLGVNVCNINLPSTLRIVEQPVLQATRVRFIAVDDNGCKVWVNASRFSGVGESDVVELSGGEVQQVVEVREYSSGFADYLVRRGISLVWNYPDVQIVQSEQTWWGKWHNIVRHRIESLFIEPDASVVLAMLLAEKGTLPDSLVAQFRATGVSHILAISGLHVSLMTGMLLIILLALPIRPMVRTAGVIVLLWLYILFIGAPISAIRAACFWTITLIAWQWQKLISLPTLLLMAVVGLLSWKPILLVEVGWQLSVSAVAGIFAVNFLARNWLADRRAWSRSVWGLILVSAGASLATGPIVAYHFGNVSFIGVAANLLVVPMVPGVLLLALIAIGLSWIWWPAALVAALGVRLVIQWMSLSTYRLSQIPGVFREEIVVPAWFLVVYYATLICLFAVLLRWQKRSWREIWQ